SAASAVLMAKPLRWWNAGEDLGCCEDRLLPRVRQRRSSGRAAPAKACGHPHWEVAAGLPANERVLHSELVREAEPQRELARVAHDPVPELGMEVDLRAEAGFHAAAEVEAQSGLGVVTAHGGESRHRHRDLGRQEVKAEPRTRERADLGVRDFEEVLAAGPDREVADRNLGAERLFGRRP